MFCVVISEEEEKRLRSSEVRRVIGDGHVTLSLVDGVDEAKFEVVSRRYKVNERMVEIVSAPPIIICDVTV